MRIGTAFLRVLSMKRYGKKAVIAIILANIILIVIAICGKILSRFDYADHLDEEVITVDGSGITLREFGYYIYGVEDFVQNQALLYDPENPKHWWNTHFSAGLDSQFVCDYAKKVALNLCTADEIYSQEAAGSGIALSSDEENRAEDEGRKMYAGMSHLQLESTGLDEKTILAMSRKHALASKYSMHLMESVDSIAQSSEPEKLVNWDGSYYLEEVLPKHDVSTNDDLLEKITLGKITVNIQE